MSRLTGLVAIAIGKSVSLGSLFLCGVLVARSSDVGEFGLYSAALTLVLVLDACFGTPLDYAAVRFAAMHAEDKQRIVQLQGAVFRFKLGIGAILLVIALYCGRGVARLVLHDPARYALIWIAAGSTFCLLMARGVAAFLQADRRFGAYALLDFAQGAGRVVAVAVLVLLGVKHAEGYLGAFGAAHVVLLLFCAIFLRQPYLTARWPGRSDTAALSRFLRLIAGIVVMGTVTGRTDLLFLSARREASELGHYAGAAQLAGVLTLLASYASVVVQPSLMAAVRRGRLSQLMRENLVIALALGACATAATYFLGGSVLATVFGESYREAHVLLSVLVIGTSLDLLCMPVPMTFALQFKPRTALLGELVITVVYLVLAVWFAERGALAMAWLVTGIRCAKAALYVGVVGNHLRHPDPAVAAILASAVTTSTAGANARAVPPSARLG